MKTEWLEAFHVTAETNSLTKASELLHMTQPALSKQIKNLEQYFDAPLLNRSTTGVTLTPAGELVFQEGAVLLGHLQSIHRRIQSAKERHSLTLGSWPSVAMSYLPHRFAARTSAESAPELKIKTAHTYQELMAGLEQHLYDAVLLDDRQIEHPYPSTHLFSERFLLFYHQDDDRFSGCSDVGFEQIKDVSFLSLPVDCDSTNILRNAFAERGASYMAAAEMEFGSSVLGFIREQLGIAILPEIFQNGMPSEIKTLSITGFEVDREISLVTRDQTHHARLLELIG